MVRKAKYAGGWYPDNLVDIQSFINPKLEKKRAIAAICPHAGWQYSGKIAGDVFSSIKPAGLYILIGPNHTGLGESVSVFSEGKWETPLGNLEVDDHIAKGILNNCSLCRSDKIAHMKEHSIEVITPFIKHFSPEAKIVPISLADYRPVACRDLGEAIADTIIANSLIKDTVIIASSDMSHFVSSDEAKLKDTMAIEKILELSPQRLLQTVDENDISMCGSGPAAAALWAANKLGASHSKLISYANSGDVTGDFKQVVGYAGIIIY